MKKIGLTCRLETNTTETRNCLDVAWTNLLKEMGFIPIIIPFPCDIHIFLSSVALDGVVLTGGNDLYCVNHNDLSLKRDEFEKEIIRECLARKIPVLGVCRGMQIICDYFGSSLTQVENHVKINHALTFNEANDSVLTNILKKIKVVNSYHNFAVSHLDENLTCLAKSEDGVVEAVKHKTEKILAHMWHPERESPFQNPQNHLIQKFLGG